MSIIEGAQVETVREFNGAKPVVDLLDISKGDAVLAWNCRFFPGRVQTREGCAPVDATATTRWSSPYYWAQGQSGNSTHYLARMDGSGATAKIVLRNLSTSTEYTIKSSISSSAIAVSFAPSGQRLFAAAMAGYYATGQAYVWDGNTSHTMDDCFQRPMKATEVTVALTEPSAGVCDAGTHYVGVLFQTRSGYWTRPGPVDSSLVLQPANISSAGSKIVRATITPATTWPTWISKVQLIYTTTLNNFEYYVVPGTQTAVTAGGATPAVIDVNVSDVQLRAVGSQGAGTLADDYFSLLSMDASNAAPFSVKFVLPWGNRMVWFGNYGGIDSFFPSDELNPEWISADQHIQQLPGGLPIGSAFVLNTKLYVVSSSGGMFEFTDNGGRPSDFQPPRMIDSRISVVGPFSTTTASNGGYAFIAAHQGLYVYSGGVFPQIPLSYYQSSEWQKMTFDPTNGLLPTVKDFPQQNIVVVQNTANSGLHVFDYKDGITPATVRYNYWWVVLPPPFFPSSFVGTEVVFNPVKKIWELWWSLWDNDYGINRVKSSVAGDSATTLYRDYLTSGTAYDILWKYQTSLLPHGGEGQMYDHQACRVRAYALQTTGKLWIRPSDLDDQTYASPAACPINLTQNPGKMFLAPYDLQGEKITYSMTNYDPAITVGSLGAANGISMTEISHYFRPWADAR